MILLFVLFSLLIKPYLCTHVLISGMTSSYGIWNPLLHIAKEILSREGNFVTFIIEESRARYLNKIQHDSTLNASNYQIIYTPKEEHLSGAIALNESSIDKAKVAMKFTIDGSYTAVGTFFSYLAYSELGPDFKSKSDLNVTFNENLNVTSNDVSKIIFDKVNVCMSGPIHLFAIYLCDVFDIPAVIRHEPAIISQLEYYNFYNTFLYFNDLNVFDGYPDNLINGTVMTYQQRLYNIVQKCMIIIMQKVASQFALKPALRKLNEEYLAGISKSVNINYKYNDFFQSIWSNAVIITSLGPPYSTVFYSRARIKQFGFLISDNKLSKDEDSEIFNWINENDQPILYVSMGSVIHLPQNALKYIYEIIVKHSKQNNYRVLWALRQDVYDDRNNDDLQKPYLKIMSWVPQIAVLQHLKVKIFMTHSGGNGVLEGLYSKTPMILFPRAGDQFFNAVRVREVGCGLMITDRETLTDLPMHVTTLMLNKTSAKYYVENLNKLHEMLLYDGGVSEAVDFLQYVGKFGSDHLFCTLGHMYSCKDRLTPWYQQTLIDIYLIIFIVIVAVVACLKRCCCKRSTIPKSKMD